MVDAHRVNLLTVRLVNMSVIEDASTPWGGPCTYGRIQMQIPEAFSLKDPIVFLIMSRYPEIDEIYKTQPKVQQFQRDSKPVVVLKQKKQNKTIGKAHLVSADNTHLQLLPAH
jgi:hypothetical protein